MEFIKRKQGTAPNNTNMHTTGRQLVTENISVDCHYKCGSTMHKNTKLLYIGKPMLSTVPQYTVINRSDILKHHKNY